MRLSECKAAGDRQEGALHPQANNKLMRILANLCKDSSKPFIVLADTYLSRRPLIDKGGWPFKNIYICGVFFLC